VVALGCALAMALPISTPPNAIAYATGEIPTGAMATTGLIIGAVGGVLLAFAMPPLWSALGLL
jgi:solute carrier family 13 (sodium-dependent dicarboxylate transporter), member 2/3/5